MATSSRPLFGKSIIQILREMRQERRAARTLRKVCAWCGVELQAGRGPVSHGICQPCADTLERGENGGAA